MKSKISSSKAKKEFDILSQTFVREKIELEKRGIRTWENIKVFTDEDILSLIKTGCGSNRNLKCLRCIAIYVCELDLLQEEAALLIHAGIPSITALAKLTPEELHARTRRLQSILRITSKSLCSLKKASNWIRKAKDFQKYN